MRREQYHATSIEGLEPPELSAAKTMNSRMLIVRVTDPEFNPMSPREVPGRFTFHMPLHLAQKLAQGMNAIYITHEQIHEWAIVCTAKRGFCVCRVTPPKEWRPDDIYDIPPDCIDREMFNMQARNNMVFLNREIMKRGGRIEQWAVVVKPLRKEKVPQSLATV